jgi:thioesterase-3|tara:strand:- start:53 stop:613 length:561 start_codon:yes stop_codon:yes gene_type:complete
VRTSGNCRLITQAYTQVTQVANDSFYSGYNQLSYRPHFIWHVTHPVDSRLLGAGDAAIKTETFITVEQEHTDELGHLNHVQAVKFMETAREDWYQQCGQPVLDPAGFGTVVVNINYNYRGECFLGEALRITTEPVERGHKSFVLRHEIIKPDGSTPLDGLATCLIMDMKARKAIPVPDWIAEHFPD